MGTISEKRSPRHTPIMLWMVGFRTTGNSSWVFGYKWTRRRSCNHQRNRLHIHDTIGDRIHGQWSCWFTNRRRKYSSSQKKRNRNCNIRPDSDHTHGYVNLVEWPIRVRYIYQWWWDHLNCQWLYQSSGILLYLRFTSWSNVWYNSFPWTVRLSCSGHFIQLLCGRCSTGNFISLCKGYECKRILDRLLYCYIFTWLLYVCNNNEKQLEACKIRLWESEWWQLQSCINCWFGHRKSQFKLSF